MQLTIKGNNSILQQQCTALMCSIRCPGSIIIKTYDIIRNYRDNKTIMISGFHSPIERDCLDLLLRGDQPVIFCPAKRIRNVPLGKIARKALSDGRLLLLSFFGEEVRRTTAQQAIFRNDVIAALSNAIFVPHAVKNGKTWKTIQKAFQWRKKVLTIDNDANEDLILSGARINHNRNIMPYE
jgi:predicted Rossmann fold nucleotide-binding protein DprA/Smf involved in DNA uptake